MLPLELVMPDSECIWLAIALNGEYMVAKLSKSYKMLFDFSKRLDALALLFKRPVKDQQFAKALPMIYYEIDVIRHLEFILRERIFKGDGAERAFGQVDMALYHAEYVLHGPDQGLDEFPSERYNRDISREIEEAASGVKGLTQKAVWKQSACAGRQALLPVSGQNY